jgi:hypothetical protein
MIATHIDSQPPGDAGDRTNLHAAFLESLVNNAHFRN